MKIQPVLAAGSDGDPRATPLFGRGPLGHAGLLARFMITAWPVMEVATSLSAGPVWAAPLGSEKEEARTAPRAPSVAACCRRLVTESARPHSPVPSVRRTMIG